MKVFSWFNCTVLSYSAFSGKSNLAIKFFSLYNFVKVKKCSLTVTVEQIVLFIFKPVSHPFLAGSKVTYGTMSN